MDKNKLIEIKKRLLALGLAGVMISSSGCNKKEKEISSEYSNVENYYKYVIQNNEAVKLYNSENVYLLFNKETYEVNEYLYNDKDVLLGLTNQIELYDLKNENMLVYSDGMSTTFNEEYYKYLLENNYQVCLTDVSDYIEGHIRKEYYSLEEIKELEPQIAEGLKIINFAKVKTK